MVALQYWLERGVPVIRARLFNLVGPRQSPDLVLSEAARQVVVCEQGGASSITLGELSPRRDFVDVHDAAEALMRLAMLGEPGEAYNVASGVSRSIRSCVEALLGLAECPIVVESVPRHDAGGQIMEQRGSHDYLTDLTGWMPEIRFEDSLKAVLEYWRSQLNGRGA